MAIYDTECPELRPSAIKQHKTHSWMKKSNILFCIRTQVNKSIMFTPNNKNHWHIHSFPQYKKGTLTLLDIDRLTQVSRSHGIL